MVEQVQAVTGRTPQEWSSDAGYFSALNLATIEAAGIDAFIPPDRQAHAAQPLPPEVARVLEAAGLDPPPVADDGASATSAKAAMRAKLATAAGRAAYAQRKKTVEPVFGQIKERRGLRRFLLRGIAKVTGEWTLWCLTHNLRNIVQALRTIMGLRQRLAAA